MHRPHTGSIFDVMPAKAGINSAATGVKPAKAGIYSAATGVIPAKAGIYSAAALMHCGAKAAMT